MSSSGIYNLILISGQTIEASVKSEDIIEKNLIEKLRENQDEIIKKCGSLFGWMLSNKINGRPQLEIKIAVPKDNQGSANSIYHQKLGIFYDQEGNVITFGGSVNETGKAWMNNIENFKVSLNWRDASDMEAVNFDTQQFEKFWNNSAKRTEVYELPLAVKEHLLRIRPKSGEEFLAIISE